MDFVAVVDQVMALLRQRGRVTYSTLKRQFQLDEAALEDVKNELIEGQRVAVDEQGNVLVWTGTPPAAARDSRPQAGGERLFHAVLRAVTGMLQREQRVTYRTLRYLFDVDEACLHAVRDELHFCQLAREEGGQGLVWTGADVPPGVGAPPPALDGVSSLPLDNSVTSLPDECPF